MPRMRHCICLMFVVTILGPARQLRAGDAPLLLDGVVVTPHVRAPRMRYTRPPNEELSARVDLVLRNTSAAPVEVTAVRFNDRDPETLRTKGLWAWHNLTAVLGQPIPPGGRTVWSYNARSEEWGPGSMLSIAIESNQGKQQFAAPIDRPTRWISALTFLGTDSSIYPDRTICHVVNASSTPVTLDSLRLFVPSTADRWAVFDKEIPVSSQTILPADRQIPADSRGLIDAKTEPLPLTYGLVRVSAQDPDGTEISLWGRVRIKRESFDISGGWVNSDTKVGPALTYEPFLKTLKRLHINTAHIAATPGYTDNEQLYAKYPLKYFNRLQPLQEYDNERILPRIHAAEFLGEPQYPNPEDLNSPQKVFDALLPYAPSRIATTVTLSDESTWRYYAGLSDYPHYDAYRVVAPHVDSWAKYDWGGKKIIWGSPLETIGDMCRSLREQSRPASTAYWAQGPHHGWRGLDGRKRRSPTPDELRLQAYHALANRITSLYWFNLSPKSLVAYRDTFDELTRVGREIGMLEDFYLEGDADFYQVQTRGGEESWDLSTIVAPRGTLLFALDLEYSINDEHRHFEFPPPRDVQFAFPLPVWQRGDLDVFRVDADGLHEVSFEKTGEGLLLKDCLSKVGVYVATSDPSLRHEIAARRERLLDDERSLDFDPAHSDDDFAELEKMVK